MLLSMTLTSLPLHSQNSPTTNAEASAEPPVVSLSEGQEAPFDGLLLTPTRAAKIHAKVELCEKEKKLAKEHFERSSQIQKAVHYEQTKQLEEALKKAEKAAQRSWYEDPGLFFAAGSVLGVVAGAATSIGLVWLAAQVRIEVPVEGN